MPVCVECRRTAPSVEMRKLRGRDEYRCKERAACRVRVKDLQREAREGNLPPEAANDD